ncbi:MAG: DUF58 domain-containing protein [Actinomycetota bacterium]|nr:DUF58 domain-containing protein [Actinomycetota bacterium]
MRSFSPKLGAYAGLTALGLIGALVTRRPELAVLAAPFGVVLAVSLMVAGRPDVRVAPELERERVIEGDEVELRLDIYARTSAPRVELRVDLPAELQVAEGENPVSMSLAGDNERELKLRIRCARWGAWRVGPIHLRLRDSLGLVAWDQTIDWHEPLRVYPRPEALRELLRPRETQVFAGNQVSREKGEGFEFADLRPFQTGDRLRRINWRASARRNELWVNEYHAERNADVVLFLDTFAEARRGATGTLDQAVRAAAALAGRYLEHKDRVGLVSFGGVLRWLRVQSGIAQLYRIVDSLISTEVMLSYAWKDVDVLPARTLPPKALVLALTPLLDERALSALLDLRARGFDLSVVEISPLPFVDPPQTPEAELALRLWTLQREARRTEYQRAGIPVVEWHEGVPLAAPIEEVSAYRRQALARG